MTSDWKLWREHFEGQTNRPLPVLVRPYGLPKEWTPALIYSLARFQLGEAGEGRIAHEIDMVQNAVIDSDYRTTLKLFIAEEGRHARILADMVQELGGSPLKSNWTNCLFTWGRRLGGIHFKLLVLFVAEIIGLGFYGLVKDRLPSGTFRAALKEIIDDESYHLLFLTEYFRKTLASKWRRVAFLFVWWPVSLVACTVVYVDHRSTWRTFRVPFMPAAQRLLALIHDASLGILSQKPLIPESVEAYV